MWHFSGFNGFSQFGKAHGCSVNRLTNFDIESVNEKFLITSAWSYNVIALDKEIFILGFLASRQKDIDKIQLPDKVIAIDSTDNYCLVLLKTGQLFKITRNDLTLEEIKLSNFCSKKCIKRKASEDLKVTTPSKTVIVEHIACGSNLAVAITSDNSVYNIPTKILQFPDTEKIVDLQCGFEHALALNTNGDVYAWGSGFRGQLGIDELRNQESPTLIEALGGIKIISIATGGWHNAAASLVGDVYTWGLNCSGQLGIRVFRANGIKDKTVHHIPQILDTPECSRCKNKNKSCKVIAVYCGARHTIVRTSCGFLFAAGWNKYGQLGLGDDRSVVDELEKINDSSKENVILSCGPWCTILKFN